MRRTLTACFTMGFVRRTTVKWNNYYLIGYQISIAMNAYFTFCIRKALLVSGFKIIFLSLQLDTEVILEAKHPAFPTLTGKIFT